MNKKLVNDRLQYTENSEYKLDIASGVLNSNSIDDHINYVFRASENAFNYIASDKTFLSRIFDCQYDELISFVINSQDIDNMMERKLLIPHLDRTYAVGLGVIHDILGLESSNIYKFAETNILLYKSQVGWICKRSDFTELLNFFKNWKLTPDDYNLEELDKVFWTEKTLSLKRDVEFFSKSKKWFDKKGLPYSRSYLLYGPPGNGKTSAIRAISNFFQSVPETFSFTGKYEDADTAFNRWIIGESRDEIDEYPFYRGNMFGVKRSEDKKDNDNPKIRILLLEDIDRFFLRDTSVPLPISFSTVLNALDGVIQRKNSIIIATANNPEKIDSQVLCRPGRFDLRIPFDPPTDDLISKFLFSLCADDKVSDDVIDSVSALCRGHSFAYVKGIYLAAANKAFSRCSEQISNDDIIFSAREFSTNLGKDIKSTRSGPGF